MKKNCVKIVKNEKFYKTKCCSYNMKCLIHMLYLWKYCVRRSKKKKYAKCKCIEIRSIMIIYYRKVLCVVDRTYTPSRSTGNRARTANNTTTTTTAAYLLTFFRKCIPAARAKTVTVTAAVATTTPPVQP